MSLLELQDVGKRYREGQLERVVLRDVSLRLARRRADGGVGAAALGPLDAVAGRGRDRAAGLGGGAL